MGYQPTLTKISEFKKSSLPSLWNFLFGIYLRCLTGRSVGLDKAHMEVYAMVAGIYYDLPVDYATHMWKEFLKSIENTNAVDGVSCARYWSLILQYAYEKESILVPADEPKAEFLKYHYPKTIEDDVSIFPTVARISDGMLKKVDPSNPVLEAYFLTINTNDGTGVLLAKRDEDSSKKSRKQKTAAAVPEEKVDQSPKKKAGVVIKVSKKSEKHVEPETDEFSKEIVPLKIGVFKRLKKKAHRSRKSPKRSSSFSPSMVRNTHVTRKGLVLRDVPIPVSPSSKK
ncbi:unnamed protein product [Lactuca virosa]|uniref:Aminotransferase-like plant mobile domain-containing protein n=1 Tax=Lactuca virosa TaxID=75947 RepID=A0AAU9NB27_9ASTR|nr:unnamed protein product [Lactuca virosa]